MKNTIILVIILAAAIGVYFLKFHKSALEKDYLQHRKAVLYVQNSHSDAFKLQTWKLKVDDIAKNGGRATVSATEIEYWMPPNAAGMNFATVATLKLEAELEKQGDRWVVIDERVLEKNTNSFEDRRNK